jgi:5'-3' exonuclease
MPKNPMPTIHLIDASPYIFRAYFSIPASMRAPDGTPANAVYGYTAFLLDLLKREQPSHLAVAFDGSLTTSFRNEIYPAYKAQRELPDEKLYAQLDACWQVTEALGMKAYIDNRYEADDLIGTIIAKLSKKDCRIVVVSGDKDLAQLVNKRTVLWDFAKDRRFDERTVKQHFGVRADQIIDLLALQGDAVDNIPGVKGIGTKTAVALLGKFASVEEIYQKLERVEKMSLRGAAAIKTRLEQGRELAFLSKQLATIAVNAPVQANLRGLQYSGAERNKVEALFDRLGFGKIRERILRWKK